MLLGKVVGSVISTIKNEELIGMKLLVVEMVNEKLVGSGKTEVVVDPIGAGNGEIVLLCKGSSARIVFGPKTPVDTVVVGIVENVVS